MKTLVGIAMLLALAQGTGNAEPINEWRDGCPAGNVKGNYKGTNPRWLGAPPQQDSYLVPSRLLVGLESGYYVASTISDENGAREQPRARILVPYASLQQNLTFIPNRYLSRLALNVLVPHGQRRSGDEFGEPPNHPGNVVVSVAYRRHLLYAFFGRPQKNEEETVPDVIAGLRVAYSIGASVAFPTGADDDTAAKLSAYTPFNVNWFSSRTFQDFDETLAMSGEIRIESVGCYAPFIHLKASVIPGSREVVALTQSVALGIHVTDHNAIYLQYALAILGANPLNGADAVHRLRAGIEHSERLLYGIISPGAFIDVMRGSDHLSGFVIGLYASYSWEER